MQELPETFTQARSADESFWQEQEKRVQGATSQPCCTLSGLSTGLIALDGDFAVVIHGETECASCFVHQGPATHRFFCTGLTEEHFVSGVTGPRLQRCLEVVIDQVAPSVIFVLGACPIEVIGDQFEEVVAEVQQAHPEVALRALHTSGLKVGSQVAMLDWLYSTLVGLPTRPPLDPAWRRQVAEAGLDVVDAFLDMSPARLMQTQRDAAAIGTPEALPRAQCLTLLGMPDPRDLWGLRPEWWDVLVELGVRVVGDLPYSASLDDWQASTHAASALVLDRANYRRTVKAMEEAGVAVYDVPLPVGIAQSDTFYEVLGRAIGRPEAVAQAVAGRRARALEAQAEARRRFAGKRLALGLRLQNNYRTDLLASEGLGDLIPLEELGFDVSCLLLGPPEKKERFEKMFARRGLAIDFEMLPDPWKIGDKLVGRFDVAVLADHLRRESDRAEVPMLVSRQLVPGYGGVSRNTDRLAELLSLSA